MQRWRRKLSAASQVASGIWPGDERGLEDRSRKPSRPSALKRSTHLATVFAVVLNRRAAAAFVSPPWTTARTISSRPFGVRRAFLCVSIRSSANRCVWQNQRSRSGPNGQPPESSDLETILKAERGVAAAAARNRRLG